MKISKEYLKQVIKEEINRLFNHGFVNESSDSTIQTKIKMSPMDFLNLTTHEEHFPLTDLKKRYDYRVNTIKQKLDNSGTDPEQSEKLAKQELANGLESALIPDLVVNKDGKVINHEGRLRSFYYQFIKQPKKDNIDVLIIHPTSLDITNPNLILKNQFDDDKFITLNKTDIKTDIKNDIVEIPDFAGVYENRLKLNEKIKNIYNSLIKNLSKEEVISKFNDELDKYTVYELADNRRKEERPLSIKMENIYNIKIYNPNTQFYSVFPSDKKIELVKK